MKKINLWIILICLPGLLLWGCAGVGQFTPQGATIATNAVTVASGLLKSLDGFYGDLSNRAKGAVHPKNPAYTPWDTFKAMYTRMAELEKEK